MDLAHLISGVLAGTVQSLIGHPLDTLKTLSQNKIFISSYYRCSLYNGLMPSLIQNSILTGASFHVNNYFFNLTNNNNLLSSLYTGILGCFVICPLEQIKINKQVNISSNRNLSSTIVHSFKHFYLVSLREVPAITIYFSSYRYFKEQQINYFISGGFSGVLSWLITYPIDTVKSRLQSNMCQSLMESIKMGNLYSGLSFCLIRAFIVNGASFFMYEKCISYLS